MSTSSNTRLPYDAQSVCALLSAALESSPVPVAISRAEDGCVVYVNPAYTRVFGYAADDVVGRTTTELGFWADPAQRQPLVDRLVRGEPVVDVPVRYRAKSGRMGDLRITASPVSADGVAYCVGILNDVTAAEAAERERHQAQKRLSIVLNAARTVVFHQDHDLRYTWIANPALGVAEHEVVGRTDDEILDADTAREVTAMKRRVLAAGVGERQVIRARNINDLAGWFDLLVEPEFDLDGRVTGILAAAADVTDAQRHSAMHSESERRFRHLLARNLARSRYLAALGHDLRTPVNAIQGMAYLLRRSGLSHEQADRVDKIEQAGRRFLDIVEPVLELARIESGRVAVRDEPLAAEEVVQEAAVRIRWKAQGVEVRASTEPFPPGLRGDAGHLQKALALCAASALDLGAAGPITVRAQPVEIRADHVLGRFEVECEGPGLDAAILPQLFDLPPPHAKAGGGGDLGLGLVIVRALAERMGGEAGADPAPGGGSTLWLTARLGLSRDA